MADPHIQSPMDHWDKVSVILYRLGYPSATLAVLFLPFYFDKAFFTLMIAATLLTSSMHLYLKSFRFIFQYVMWAGLLLALIGQTALALGAGLLVIGGLSFKEYFCFRIRGLNFQPIFVTLLWLSLQLNWQMATIIFAVIVSVLLFILSIQKWRMPLHFDIGDKGKYQV